MAPAEGAENARVDPAVPNLQERHNGGGGDLGKVAVSSLTQMGGPLLSCGRA
jgi:hypothetical protein